MSLRNIRKIEAEAQTRNFSSPRTRNLETVDRTIQISIKKIDHAELLDAGQVCEQGRPWSKWLPSSGRRHFLGFGDLGLGLGRSAPQSFKFNFFVKLGVWGRFVATGGVWFQYLAGLCPAPLPSVVLHVSSCLERPLQAQSKLEPCVDGIFNAGKLSQRRAPEVRPRKLHTSP